MNEQDKIWMAGFFDGEGNIQLYLSAPTYSNRHGQYSLRVYIVNTGIVNAGHSILEQFSSFGGAIFETPKTSRWKMAYRWYITGSDAKRFLEAILPYLKLKKEIARLGIELQTCIEDWKHSYGSKRLSAQEIAKRDTLIAKFRELQPPQLTKRSTQKVRRNWFTPLENLGRKFWLIVQFKSSVR